MRTTSQNLCRLILVLCACLAPLTVSHGQERANSVPGRESVGTPRLLFEASKKFSFGPAAVALGSSALAVLETGAVRLYDTRSGRLLRTLSDTKPIETMAVSPTGGMMALANAYRLRIVPIGSKSGGRKLPEWPLRIGRKTFTRSISVVFSPDGKKIAAAATSDNAVAIGVWDVASGRRLRTSDSPSKEPMRDISTALYSRGTGTLVNYITYDIPDAEPSMETHYEWEWRMADGHLVSEHEHGARGTEWGFSVMPFGNGNTAILHYAWGGDGANGAVEVVDAVHGETHRFNVRSGDDKLVAIGATGDGRKVLLSASADKIR